jgi:hypothetical protein
MPGKIKKNNTIKSKNQKSKNQKSKNKYTKKSEGIFSIGKKVTRGIMDLGTFV